MGKNRNQFEAFQKMECPLEWALYLNSNVLQTSSIAKKTWKSHGLEFGPMLAVFRENT
jgi:hypothetical protein